MHPDRLLRRFDVWEARTRGYSSRSFHVPVEPPFRALFAKARVRSGIIDDGRKPGLFQRLGQKVKARSARPDRNAFGKPVPCDGWAEHVELRLIPRPDASVTPAISAAFLSSLSGIANHVSFELVGLPDRVIPQIACSTADLFSVRGSLRGYLPDLRVQEGEGLLLTEWERTERFAVVLDLVLRDRSFLMLRADGRPDPDPFIEVVQRMEGLAGC